MKYATQPKEIFLLERYTSLEYFGELRDVWGKMISHLEDCLAAFMQNLPPDYRARPLPEQPDIVWGERVLPNFRETFQGLCDGYIKLSHRDASGLHFAVGPVSDFKGQSDFSVDWMSTSDQNTYGMLLSLAVDMAGKISASEGAYWQPLDLTAFASEIEVADVPPSWPSYRVNSNVSVTSGSKTKQDGIYVPDKENSGPQFLSTKYAQAPEAQILVSMKDLLNPATGVKYGEHPIYCKQPCTWFLVERASSGTTPTPSLLAVHSHRLAAGETCAEAGYYFTPAHESSRRRFEKGETMPDLDTGYGKTIWQWDSRQE